jgi:mannose-6-phosphate isomerase-like protein (cupin superfamily)
MPFIDPADMLSGEPLPGWSGRFFHAENMTFALYDIAEGATPLHEHHHVQEEVWNVVEGELRITVDGVERTVSAGSAVVVPPDTPHSVTPTGPCRAVIADYPVRLQIPGLAHLTES